MNPQYDFPIAIDTTSAQGKPGGSLKLFDSYHFERNIMVPAAAFRFTAPGADKAERMAIRSADMVELYTLMPTGQKVKMATGILDETDTHIHAKGVDYVLTGRDMLAELVDKDAVDAQNRIIYVASITLTKAVELFLSNTRLARARVDNRGAPSGQLLLQTNVGESKISALQRYAEYCNCLIWSLPDGTVAVGKPNMHQAPAGALISRYSDPSQNNVLDARVRRNTNQAIRQLAVQLQNLQSVSPAPITLQNRDRDVLAVAQAFAGCSRYRVYTLGNGMDAVNTLTAVGQGGGIGSIGNAYALRQLAMENVKVLDVEAVVEGHVNENGIPYNTDQVYSVEIEDEDVKEPLYVYNCTYELTKETGKLTRMRLCRPGCIVADVPQYAKGGT